jgi:hypothetical protein
VRSESETKAWVFGRRSELWRRRLCNIPSGNGMSSHRGCTSYSRISFRRALAGTDESLMISASSETCIYVRMTGLNLTLKDSSTPSRDQTTAFPAQSTSAFLYVPIATIDDTTRTSVSLLARQTAPFRRIASSNMKWTGNQAANQR